MSPDVSIANIRSVMDGFYKDYYLPVDKRSFAAIVGEYDKNISDQFKPEYFKELMKLHKTTESLADFIFENSVFSSKERAFASLEKGISLEMYAKDPALLFYNAFNEFYNKNIKQEFDEINSRLTLLYRTYMRGQMEFDRENEFYPDANSTLRITYGKVRGYAPSDGVYYKHFSTLEGIMEKDNPNIYDYDIPQKLRDIYKVRDFGKWSVNGTVPVCFVATNHTSGGNSGSPVLNAEGNLIGINFDRVWEGTMSDIVYDPSVCRNISLDVRYVLFVVDKVAGAGHLINEMKLVK